MTETTIVFRPDMKTVLHEVDGRPANVSGQTIDIGKSGLNAMLEVYDDSDLRVGAKVRVSYVEPSGVHTFDSVITASDPLALNHRKVRVTIASPGRAERIQRREHVRVAIDLVASVERVEKDQQTMCRTIDLSAGGVALAWPAEDPVPPIDEVVQVRFRSERFSHDHLGVVLGSHTSGDTLVVRLRFTALSPAERDRLVSVVFAAQRDELKRQREAARVR
ncbi:flagellar brake protein [Actinomarinicola tropica]|uniref:PilZ domain-containing protein n=1 Tax=Actinomarinicola tropica TaxID=2789776 RepID=A0A5Q2RLX7_9ACTN|nr:PilZ domain-containing protein [Actinomarinicola tropica]QGG95087.1 hypothetical protein GH723_08200 [Actinomarinicola tropica]